MKIKLLLCSILLLPVLGFSQKINTDSLYFKARDLYFKSKFAEAEQLAKQGIEAAPEYHDIRILLIRTELAQNKLDAANEQFDYLIKVAPDYPDVPMLGVQVAQRNHNQVQALQYVNQYLEDHPNDKDMRLKKVNILMELGEKKEARYLIADIWKRNKITEHEQRVLIDAYKRSGANEIGAYYNLNTFSDDYGTDHGNWSTYSLEYQFSIGQNVFVPRFNYADRAVRGDGSQFEIDAYPVFSDRFYAFANVGVSGADIYPEFRGSLSLFYTIFKTWELEGGFRYINFNKPIWSEVIGVGKYAGHYLIRAKAFLGPNQNGKLAQNYQLLNRLYFKNIDDYIFLNLAKGISPDQQDLILQTQNNQNLDIYSATFGARKIIGNRHIIEASIGYFYEDITDERSGNQINFNLGYRIRF
ncbi:YaiO family outer membrane beta-barrel protein [Zhouia sp. PK063]|uniref:YaiO family outer membrane beta-barrel protein n=1 Tax=Zhouia sp. PK063 TaxID=3373602 RepID=UPI0037AE3B38